VAPLRRTPPDDPRLQHVLQVWRANGLRPGTISYYALWVRRFIEDRRQRGRDADADLTLPAVVRFVEAWVGQRGGTSEVAMTNAPSALRAWSWGLAACGHAVPTWRPPPRARRMRPVLREFVEYRRSVRGIAVAPTASDLAALGRFFAFLRARGRSPSRVRLVDVDAHLVALRSRVGPRTVQIAGGRIRAFLRFLHVSGRLPHDLASCVVVPSRRRDARPPRALPWDDVRRILAAIDRSTRVGLRDHALLLTMATYGLGAGEAFALRLEDVDWRGSTLRFVRPKTGREIVLPLLGPVARSLAAYLRRARPRHTSARTVFVRMHAPFGPIRTAASVARILRKHAQAARVSASHLGGHTLRHSHATRQIDLGASAKVVGDILGHDRPATTSVYVRVALRRLRSLALPVPS